MSSTDSFVESSFRVSREMRAVVVSAFGEFDVAGSTRLGAELADLVEDQGNLTVVVDLARTTGVHPAALGVLAAAAKLARHHGGRLTLRGAAPAVHRALEDTGVGKVLTSPLSRAPAAPHGCDAECRPLAVRRGPPPAAGHSVVFYEREHVLGDAVCEHLMPVLSGDAAIVVATAPHRALFETQLGAAGVDVDEARRSGRYVDLDAEEALASFMVDGLPDPALFRSSIGNLVAGAGRRSGKVVVYGEMVAVLWASGNVAAAIALEDLWNDLGRSERFSLLCAYPLTAFEPADARGSFRTICAQHAP